MSDYKLMVKSINGGVNPAMRTGNVALDEGRPWSGDLYDEGPVTDPSEAYAQFGGGGEDTEAWLDRGDDGTLIGWVREGDDIYRYSDIDAWVLDVDGAGMSRTDTATSDVAPDADPAAGEDPAADPANDGDLFDTDVSADPETELADAPEAFDAESDEATTEEDPTAALEDPADLPPDADTEDDTNPFDGLGDDDATGVEDPADEATEDPAEEATEDPTEEAAETAEEPDAAEDEAAEPTTEEETEEEKRKRILAGRIQVKHLPGRHNQEEHGNWADHIPHVDLPRPAGQPTASSTGSGGSSPAPKAGEAGARRARLTPESIKALSDEDLEALMDSPDLFDGDTMLHVAQEWDDRHDAHKAVEDRLGDAEPGSPEEAAAFDSVIPSAWVTWAGRGSKGGKPSMPKKEQIASEYDAFWRAQMARAEEENRGVLLKRGVTVESLAKAHMTPEDLFNGRMSGAQLRKYASEELLRWFAASTHNRHLSFREWMAEFYPSYAKLMRDLGSTYLSEHG